MIKALRHSWSFLMRTREIYCQNLWNRSENSPDSATNDSSNKFLICANTSIFGRPLDLRLQKNENEICFSGGFKYEKGSGLKICDLIDEMSKMLGGNLPPSIKEYTDATIQKLTVTYKCNNNTNKEDISPNDKYSEFKFGIAIEDIFNLGTILSLKELDLDISKLNSNPIDLYTHAIVVICDTELQLALIIDSGKKIFQGKLDKLNITIKDILIDLGINNTGSIPDAILNFEIGSIDVKYEFEEVEKNLSIAISTNYGKVTIKIASDKESKKTWCLTYETKNDENKDLLNLDVLKIPVAGELVKTIDPTIKNTTINDFKVSVSSDNGVNIILGCMVFGTAYDITIPLSKPTTTTTQLLQTQQNMLLKNSCSFGPAFNGTAVWKKFDKPITILILTIPKIGFGLDNDGNIVILLDASLNVSPLTFSLNEAGIGVNISKLTDIHFYLSGFGVSFDNGVLSIAGGLSMGYDENKNPQYSGLLSIRFKEIGLTAIGQYTKLIEENKETAALCACFALLAPLGGIPAFFVKGIAGGFGYNERLILPPIEKVNEYFLIKAAMDGFRKDLTPKEILAGQVKAENGQFFLAAGLKFTTFETIEGCMIVTASFGNDFELGLLGLAKLSVPPKVKTNPIAYAELAIKASVKPFDGVFSVEAQLTNRSYILCKDCKLTGGFAAYAWFGKNDHSGDFVVTLGGYHPSYNRPEHYPVVPRLGLNWQVDSHLNINGEIYFAITPNALMAGGKLSATYTLGPLKAWFIAYADILMKWKPFAYNIAIGVLVGASYTMKVWKISKTFSVELGADLRLWGPEVHGEVYVSWFIISFTISFSEGADHSKDTLDWNGFKQTFLISPKENNNLKQGALQSSLNGTNDEESSNILSINLQGVIAQTADGIDIVSAQQLGISALSKIPENKDGSIHIKPAGSKWNIFNSSMSIVVENNEVSDKFNREKILQNLPAALWGDEKTNDLDGTNCLVKDQVCGEKLSIKASDIDLFPKNQFIQLSVLYENNIIHCYDSFTFSGDISLKLDNGEETIGIFTTNEIDNKNKTTTNRNNFLKAHGLSDEDVKDISLTKFAKDADNLLSESILIINV